MLTTTGTKPNHLTGRAGIVRCPPCSPKESPAGAREKPNMIDRKTMWKTTSMLLTGVIASSILAFQVRAQSNAPAGTQAPSSPSVPTDTSPGASAQTPRRRFQADRFAGRARTYYSLIWGVDSLSLKWAEQGEIIRFAYRILDPSKAKILNDKTLEPALIDPQAGVKLVVPALEQVGILRQTGTPEAGKVYWMAFSNKGRKVKRGDHVIVQIGQFRADGLVVD